jgi:hypothetical protein
MSCEKKEKKRAGFPLLTFLLNIQPHNVSLTCFTEDNQHNSIWLNVITLCKDGVIGDWDVLCAFGSQHFGTQAIL